MKPITFSCSYTLAEYVRVVRQHAPRMLAKQRPSAAATVPQPSLAVRTLIPVVATLSFFVKKLQMPRCDFVIDEHHIRRTSAAGELLVAWPEVVQVHRYSHAFLVEKARGAVLLPYRCFSPEQSAAFERLVHDQHRAPGSPKD